MNLPPAFWNNLFKRFVGKAVGEWPLAKNKAARVKAEPELIAQLEKAPRIFEAFGIPMYESATFEADDVVGTIVHQMTGKQNLDIVVASGDMDTLQLVRPGVSGGPATPDDGTEASIAITGLGALVTRGLAGQGRGWPSGPRAGRSCGN